MAVDIDELAERAGFPSRDALAKKVLELWADPTQSHRNIGIKLLELQRGKRSWWMKRAKAAEALATALEVELGALQLARPAGTGLFSFEDFPQARGFDAQHELPCALGNEAWFEPLGEQDRWIQAPPGSGRSFTACFHQHRYGARLVRALTLAEALAQLPRPESVVLEIEHAEEQDKLLEQQLLAWKASVNLHVAQFERLADEPELASDFRLLVTARANHRDDLVRG
jgi:hypothetical protein